MGGSKAPDYTAAPAVEKAKIPEPNDQEKQIKDSAYALQNTAFQGANNILPTSAYDIQKYAQALYEPQNQVLTDTYDKAMGDNINNASSMGTRGSVGFNNYANNVLTKNLANSQAQAMDNAQISAYNLPDILMQPYMNASNMSDSTLGNLSNRLNTQFGWDSTNAQMANNYNLSTNQNLNAFNLDVYKTQVAQQAAQQQQQQQQAAQAAQVAMMFSDKNLKKNIKLLKTINGINIYEFEYKDGYKLPKGNRIGVMAQEIENIIPEAVIETPIGKAVNYALVFPRLMEAA